MSSTDQQISQSLSRIPAPKKLLIITNSSIKNKQKTQRKENPERVKNET